MAKVNACVAAYIDGLRARKAGNPDLARRAMFESNTLFSKLNPAERKLALRARDALLTKES